MGSRANMKMQLQRDKALMEEKRLRQASQNAAQASKSSSSSTINMPVVTLTSPPQLPVQVLKVETGLQNPTQYHVRETQRNQVREYISQSHKDGSKYMVRQLFNPSQSAPTNAGDAFHANSTPASPLARLNLSTDPMTDIIDDIVSLESSFGDEPRFDRNATTLQTVSPSDLGSFARSSAHSLPVISNETSSSCPVIKREFTEEDARLFAKDRIKKDNHNIIERRRRYNINDRIRELGHLVPKSSDPELRWNKGSILKAAVDYIQHLQNDQQKHRALEQRSKQMETMNKKLLLRVQELEMTVQQYGINVDNSEKQGMMNQLLNFNTAPTAGMTDGMFTAEEEHHVANFPTNAVSPQNRSPGTLTSQTAEIIVYQQPEQVAPGANTNPDQQFLHQQQQQQQQLLTVDSTIINDQQQPSLSPNHQMQGNFSPANYNQQSPLGSAASSTLSPTHSEMNMQQQQQQQQQQQTQQQQQEQSNTLNLNLDEVDMTAFQFPANNDADPLTSIMGGGFSSLLTSEPNQFNDVMMVDDYGLIKDDIFLSDANQ
uniref:Transcription factor protein n=3 Tax=Ciona intestinalis TaxID=7719 RepID=Q4H369_CIOIN|nr:transcription factor protein [Ciona intestinalis]NP_001087207.1 transcription factor protein [Ciona intestinalis]BAE06557.1 transcription factor protein [Ciona intestinalis]BAE06558.1 transcription factor protein [Ciona intestinalis]|eukprot:NP_001071764.1 transcription factor protein [Ciona intestinalis]